MGRGWNLEGRVNRGEMEFEYTRFGKWQIGDGKYSRDFILFAWSVNRGVVPCVMGILFLHSASHVSFSKTPPTKTSKRTI